MQWTSMTSPVWMKARDGYLCASEIAPLAKKYSRSKPETLRSMGKLKAKKLADVAPDPMSYGDAAKGHICEPYAVASFNEHANAPEVMFHYDDLLVVRNGIGWSPDAMDILQAVPADCVIQSEDIDPTACLEVKSYGPEHYYEASRTPDKLKLDERWQVAAAMYVCPTIETGYLLFYCPEIHEATLFPFDRKELDVEINTVNELREMWDSVDVLEIPASRQVWKVEESIESLWIRSNL